jgi:hypothetical protein
MQEEIWKEVTTQYQKDEGYGEERWLRMVEENCWVSVLHRMTGFGYMEWETAVCVREDGKQKTNIIRGDWRNELSTMNKEELLRWYDDNIEGNKNSMETFLDLLV